MDVFSRIEIEEQGGISSQNAVLIGVVMGNIAFGNATIALLANSLSHGSKIHPHTASRKGLLCLTSQVRLSLRPKSSHRHEISLVMSVHGGMRRHEKPHSTLIRQFIKGILFLMVAVGGDGTVLSAAHFLDHGTIPLLGINSDPNVNQEERKVTGKVVDERRYVVDSSFLLLERNSD